MAALNFPSAPANGDKWVDPNGQSWVYETTTNSWTAEGVPAPGMVYKGGIDITAAPPTGVQAGWVYTVTTGGTANAGFTGLTGKLAAGTQIIYDGAQWQEQGVEVWTRTGTTLSPATAGDDVDLGTGDLSAAAGTFSGVTRIGAYDAAAPVAADQGVWITPNGAIQANKASGALWIGNANAVTTSAIEADGTIMVGGDIAGNSPNITLRPRGSIDSVLSLANSWINISLNKLYAYGQGNNSYISFKANGTQIGHVAQNSVNSVAYLTSSDYRLKENVLPLAGSTDRLKQLKPCSFNWISDKGARVDGFLAHEAQAVVPESVEGGKDAVDEEGSPVYQGIDQSKLVPLLTAALQESITRIETLEAKVAALESA